MRPITRKRQIHRMARQALLTFKEGIPILSLPAKSHSVDQLFRLAHLARFDRPLPVSLN
jgi:hypothetical protein